MIALNTKSLGITVEDQDLTVSSCKGLRLGPTPEVSDSMDAINSFLGVMAFASPANRTNTVAAAITVLLRPCWMGAKPIVLITATKSHAGKGTIPNPKSTLNRNGQTIGISENSGFWTS